MELYTVLALVAALAALLVLGVWSWRRSHRKSPEERERARRLAVNTTGRIAEAVLVESPFSHNSTTAPGLIFYRYYSGGVEYTAAQDVSTLLHLIDTEQCRAGAAVVVKYDPRRVSNSILICEEWSGLKGPRESGGAPPPSRSAYPSERRQ